MEHIGRWDGGASDEGEAQGYGMEDPQSQGRVVPVLAAPVDVTPLVFAPWTRASEAVGDDAVVVGNGAFGDGAGIGVAPAETAVDAVEVEHLEYRIPY